MPFPSVPGKHVYPSAFRPAAFLDALRAGGWEPGPVPESVVFTYARFELYLVAHPELYTPNHVLGTGPGRFFLINATDGRDEGTSHHYLPAGTPAVPDMALTGSFGTALDDAGLGYATGATVTTDAPYRTTAAEILLHRANGALAQDMEAAALFAVGQVRGLPVASAVVINEVPAHDGTTYQMGGGQRAGQALRGLFTATVAFLGSIR
jgi:hypothetical protein